MGYTVKFCSIFVFLVKKKIVQRVSFGFKLLRRFPNKNTILTFLLLLLLLLLLIKISTLNLFFITHPTKIAQI